MAIETNGRLWNVLEKYPPNASITIITNGQHLTIGSIRFYTKEMRIEIITQAMSDAELFGDLDEDAENGLDSIKPALQDFNYTCENCNAILGGFTPDGDISLAMVCPQCKEPIDLVSVTGQPFKKGVI